MLLSHMKKGLTSLFKEVRVFKEDKTSLFANLKKKREGTPREKPR